MYYPGVHQRIRDMFSYSSHFFIHRLFISLQLKVHDRYKRVISDCYASGCGN